MRFEHRIKFVLAFCFCWISALAQDPIVSITKAKLHTAVEIDYKITNISAHDIYVFSPFLENPFDARLKETEASEQLWTTFTPEFKGNYFADLEFVKIAAGESYTGHINSVYAAQRLNNCTRSRRLSVQLAIGWAYETEHALDEVKMDSLKTIAIVQRWQTVALSQKYSFDRTKPPNPQKCPAHESVEIWR